MTPPSGATGGDAPLAAVFQSDLDVPEPALLALLASAAGRTAAACSLGSGGSGGGGADAPHLVLCTCPSAPLTIASTMALPPAEAAAAAATAVADRKQSSPVELTAAPLFSPLRLPMGLRPAPVRRALPVVHATAPESAAAGAARESASVTAAAAAAAMEPATASRVAAFMAQDPLSVGFEAIAFAESVEAGARVPLPTPPTAANGSTVDAGGVVADLGGDPIATADKRTAPPQYDAGARAELIAAQVCALLSLPLRGGLADSLDTLPASVRVVA